MPATTRPLFEQIDSWLQEIDNTKTASAPAPSKPAKKTAATKKAGPDGMGKTTHPSDDVDNNTQDEQTGARYEENSSDVKKDVPGQAVDETDPKSGGGQDDKQYNIGTQQSATGEDSSVEDDYKGDKDDPGTDHPMDAESVGEKYSSMNLKQLLKVAEDKAHGILADMANGIVQPQAGQSVQQKAAAVKAAKPAETTVAAQTQPKQPEKTATVGFDAAQQAADMEKAAADFVAQTINDANLDADLVGTFLHSYQQSRAKKAADEGGEGEDHKEPTGDAGGEGGAPPTDDGAGAGAGVLPPPGAGGGGGGGDVLSALGAGGAGGGDPGAGGMPPPDAGAGAGAGAGGMSQEQALQELAMALQELGINPEELAQMAQQGGPAGAGGGDVGAGMGGAAGMGGGAGMGALPPPPPAAAEGAKLASAVKQFKRAGKFKFEAAKTAAQRQARDQIKDYIREITGTNR